MGRSDQRTIVIGDVHGCYLELAELLRAAHVRPGVDRVIFIGDLINKGPDSGKVWELFQSVEGVAVMGNHELSMLQVLDGSQHKHEKYREDLEKDFGTALAGFVAAVRCWPCWLETDDCLLVHAGVRPGVHPQDSDPWLLTTIRTWDGTGMDLLNPDNPPWYTYYEGRKPIVFGHWAALGGLNRENAIGLDTGCVYGGMLTALIMPERRFVRVKAHAQYFRIKH